MTDEQHEAAIVGLYADKLPPVVPTLGGLIDRAAEASRMLDALGIYGTDDEYARRDDVFLADRSEVHLALRRLGLTRAQIAALGRIL